MKIVYASLLVVALIGCWADTKIDIDNIQPVALSEEKVKLVQSDTLIFELDSLTSPKSWMHQFKVIKEVPYFFIANTAINAIQAYNFNLKKVEKIIPFKTVGANSIRLRENFYVHNWDSLFLFTNAPNKVFLFDSSAILRQSWSIMLREEHKDFTITTQEYYFKPYFKTPNSSVGFWMYPPTSPYSKDYFRNAKAVEYNLSKATYITYGQYPSNYFAEVGTHVVMRPINGYLTDYNILYFGASPLIYLYDKETKTISKVINARSRYINHEIPPLLTNEPENQATYEETVKYYLTTGCYEYMFSNEDNSYHFRIVKHSADFLDKSGKIKSNDEFEFSIMIFDCEFKLINEFAFPGNTYDFRQAFAYGRQLYLNLNNPQNKRVDEDHLQFQIFNF